MRMIRSLVIAVAAAAGLAACATVEDTAHVAYAAHGAPAAAAASVRVTVTAADARVTNRGRISTKKNGYGMEMAAIAPPTMSPTWSRPPCPTS